MILILTILANLLFISFAQNRVVEITTTNVQLVLRTVSSLHLLLHNPNCQYSRDFAQKFLQVKTPLQMGIADCQREKELCNHLNVTHFPTLVQLTNSTITRLDEQQFLLAEGLAEENDPKIIVNKIVKKLKGEPGWAAVVLEEEGLPVLERVQQETQVGVFYVSPPSRLYTHLSALVGRKMGCWILALREGQVKKYYCGNGYKSEELLKYLSSFGRDNLVSHTFTREVNNTYLGQAELAQIVKQKYAVKKCKLIYFHSRHCEHCSLEDVKRIDGVLTALKLKKQYQLKLFDLDYEELPANFHLKRIPELVQFCNFQIKQFGDAFTIKTLTKFIETLRDPPIIHKAPQPKSHPEEPKLEAAPSKSDERLEL